MSRRIGDVLKGSKLGEFWKYRVGDWYLICEIRARRTDDERIASNQSTGLAASEKAGILPYLYDS
ncbi:type II toxin-antitoxin system RelE family toxin [Solimicrobium silvestre]|uniref:Uncharacterized protein n=1 Tax=Solimicrobium silvestre TaxID=2099400 RepID=A0A2S9GUH2_9BURK|nr:hypothetical protein [Solimicrobium silvestre]PRC91353.1 hypothetical protein S2091_3898 [Solimicrobium silvestre]